MITDINNITIEKAIMHILDTKSNITLSDNELPLSDEEFKKFLVDHISNSLTNRNRFTAKFNKINSNIVKSNSNQLLNQGDFIEISKTLARLLYRAMKTRINTSPADVVICTYKNEKNEHYLALLMLDYQKNFFHETIQNEENGQITVKYTKDLLSFAGSLKKCAFIQKYSSDNEYDLIILVKNSNNVASFFKEEFLDVEFTLNDTRRTELFAKLTDQWAIIKQTEQTVNSDLLDKIENIKTKCIEYLNEKEEISIKDFVNENILDINLKSDYSNYLDEKGLIDNNFKVDKQYVERLKYKKIKMYNGIEVKVPLGIYEDEEAFTKYISEDGNYDINIRNSRLLNETITKI